MIEKQIISNSKQDTIEAGYNFAGTLELSVNVLLYGDLGAGKTEFCRGICQYFNVETYITSPTFTIINQYNGLMNNFDFTIYHIDLYRIKSHKEIEEIGLDEFLNDEFSIKLIEWPEKYTNVFPKDSIELHFLFDENDVNKRIISIVDS